MIKLSTREILLILIATIVIMVRYFTDPNDSGAATIEFLMYVCAPTFVVLISHWLRKILLPYIKMENVFKKAMENAYGAGLVFLGMSIIIYGLFGLFGPSARAQDVTTYIPPRAVIHLPVLVNEQKTLWSLHPNQVPLQG